MFLVIQLSLETNNANGAACRLHVSTHLNMPASRRRAFASGLAALRARMLPWAPLLRCDVGVAHPATHRRRECSDAPTLAAQVGLTPAMVSTTVRSEVAEAAVMGRRGKLIA